MAKIWLLLESGIQQFLNLDLFFDPSSDFKSKTKKKRNEEDLADVGDDEECNRESLVLWPFKWLAVKAAFLAEGEGRRIPPDKVNGLLLEWYRLLLLLTKRRGCQTPIWKITTLQCISYRIWTKWVKKPAAFFLNKIVQIQR